MSENFSNGTKNPKQKNKQRDKRVQIWFILRGTTEGMCEMLYNKKMGKH